jgi:hypothetical protein
MRQPDALNPAYLSPSFDRDPTLPTQEETAAARRGLKDNESEKSVVKTKERESCNVQDRGGFKQFKTDKSNSDEGCFIPEYGLVDTPLTLYSSNWRHLEPKPVGPGANGPRRIKKTKTHCSNVCQCGDGGPRDYF